MASTEELAEEVSLTIGILGADHIITKLVGEALGTPGTKSDLQYYNRLDLALKCVFTAVDPITYSEKIKSLIQTCAETKIHVMCIDASAGITPEIGEIIIAMEIFAREFQTRTLTIIGGITGANEWRIPEIRTQLQKFVASTVLKGMEIVPLKERADYQSLKEKIVLLGKEIPQYDPSNSHYAKVLIDHAFPVKGVGTVVLGVVVEGQIRAGDMYDLVPVQNKVILRSIQKFDRDFKTATKGDRVGLALKGVRAEDVDRNAIFGTMGEFSTSSSLEGTLRVSPYYKPQNDTGKLNPIDTIQYYLIVDLGVSPVKLTRGNPLAPGETGAVSLELSRPLVHDHRGLHGILMEFGPFIKRSRIIGTFIQNP